MITTIRSFVLLMALLCVMPASAALLPASPPDAAPDTAPAPTSITLEQAAGEDDRITARLNDIFTNVPSLTGITVDVSGGVVTLGGTVADDASAARAETLAAGVEGVVTVENAIERDASVKLGEQVDTLQDRVASLVRFLPLIAVAITVGLIIAGFGYLLASFAGLWRRLTPNSFLADLIATAIRFVFIVLGVVIALDMIGATALLGAVLGRCRGDRDRAGFCDARYGGKLCRFADAVAAPTLSRQRSCGN